jgi:hypothetical protein
MIYLSSNVNTMDSIPTAQQNEFIIAVNTYKGYVNEMINLQHINKKSIYSNFYIFSTDKGLNIITEWMKDFSKKKNDISVKKGHQLSFVIKKYDTILKNIYDKSYNVIIKNISNVITAKSTNNIDNYINYYIKLKKAIQEKYSKKENFSHLMTLIQTNLNILFELKKIQQLCGQLNGKLPINSNIMTLCILTYIINEKQAINNEKESMLKTMDFNEIINKFIDNIKVVDDNTKPMATKLSEMSSEKINLIINNTHKSEISINILYEILKIISNSL